MATPQISTIVIKKVDLNKQTTQNLQMSGFVGSKPVLDLRVDHNYEIVSSDIPDDLMFTSQQQVFTIEIQHKTEKLTRDLVAKRIIEYSVSDNKKTLEPLIQSVEIKQNGLRDLVTKQVTWQVPDENYYFDSVKSPILSGYTPDLSSVDSELIDIDCLETNIVVNYMPNPQIAKVNFVDNGKTLDTAQLTGLTGQLIVADDNLNNAIKQFIDKGYLIADNPLTKSELIFQDHTSIKIQLKHHLVNVTSIQPLTGEDIRSNLSKTVRRTIHFEGFTSKVQSHTFKRSAQFDYVTKKLNYSKWSSDAVFAQVVPPTKDGYDPSIDVIDELRVTPDSKNKDITVTYAPQARKIVIKLFDQTSNSELNRTELSGVVGQVIDFDLKSMLNKHGDYKLSDETLPTLEFDVKQPVKYYNINLAHKILTVSDPSNTSFNVDLLSKTITRTVNFNAPKQKNLEPVVQSHTFKRQAKIDLVTHKITYTPWENNITFDSVTPPKIEGYIATGSVSKVSVRVNNHSQTVNINYKAQRQTIKVNIFDKTLGKLIKTELLQGYTDELVSKRYKLDKLLNYPKYDIINNGLEDVFDNLTFKASAQEYNVSLKHKTVHLDALNGINPLTGADFSNQLTKTHKLVISYKAGKQTLLADKALDVKLNRSAELDLVTNNIKYNSWYLKNSGKVIQATDVDDYTPHVDSINIDSLNLLAGNSTYTFWYYLTKQTVQFDFVDVNTHETIDNVQADIYYADSNSKYDLGKKIEELTQKGYNVLTKDSKLTVGYDIHSFKPVREYTIKVSERELVDYDKHELKRTIIVNEPNSNRRIITQTAVLKQKRITNLVTGIIKKGEIIPSHFDAVIMTPILNYEVDHVLIPAKSVDENSKSETVYVTYSKLSPALTYSEHEQKTSFMRKLLILLGFDKSKSPDTQPKQLNKPDDGLDDGKAKSINSH